MFFRKTILALLVVAAIATTAWLLSGRLDDPSARLAVYACAALFALAIIRTTFLRPLLVAHRWRTFARDRTYQFATGEHGEPRIIGEHAGVRFILAQSTALLGGGGGYYARTVITATIGEGVPDGLRAYRRDAREWMHPLSGLRTVETGDKVLDEALLIEGSRQNQTRRWVLERRGVLAALWGRYPRFILYGSEIDGLPVADGDASGALTVLIVGRVSKAPQLDQLIETVTLFVREL